MKKWKWLICICLLVLLTACGTSERVDSELEGSWAELSTMVQQPGSEAEPALPEEVQKDVEATDSEQTVSAPEQTGVEGAADTAVSAARSERNSGAAASSGALLERRLNGTLLWEIFEIPIEEFLRTYPENRFPMWSSGALNGTDYQLGSIDGNMAMLRIYAAAQDDESQKTIEDFISNRGISPNIVCIAKPYYVYDGAEELVKDYYNADEGGELMDHSGPEEPQDASGDSSMTVSDAGTYSDAYYKVYGAGDYAGVDNGIRDAFVSFIESQSGFMTSYGSWTWTFEKDANGQIQLQCLGPEVTDETGAVGRMTQYLLYSDGNVSWGPSGLVYG